MTNPSKIILDFIDELVAGVRAHFPVQVVKEVEFFDGEFGTDEIDRYSKVAPSIIISMDGGESTSSGNSINETLKFDAFVLTKSDTARKRTAAALIIYEHFLRFLHFPPTFVAETQNPSKIISKNLFGEKIDEMGLALWVCRWEQRLTIPGAINASTLDNFVTLYLTNTVAQDTTDPGNGPVDEQTITLEQPP